MSTWRLYQIVCDGCGVPSGSAHENTTRARRMAKRNGWKSVAGNGAARGPNRTERTDYCPKCEVPK